MVHSSWTHIIALALLVYILSVDCRFAIRSRPVGDIGECISSTGDFKSIRKEFLPHSLEIPIDHFHNESRYEPHSDAYFSNRYWFDDTYYRPGGPVIVENTGEFAGTFSLPDLQAGLLHELAKTTGGIAVLLEHRYFGASEPEPVHTTENFRFLSVEQAMADQAYFAEHVVFPRLEHLNLTAPNTPWFAIGGSYPGELTAFLRIQYPDIYWGAIASSAVTANKQNCWEYMEALQEYSPPKCVAAFQKILNIADGILLGGNATEIHHFKSLFDYANVNASNADFAYDWLQFPYDLQSRLWIPCLEEYTGLDGCKAIESDTLLYPKAEQSKEFIKAIVMKSRWANGSDSVTASFLNYIGHSNGYPKDNSTSTSTRRQSRDLRRRSDSHVLKKGEPDLAFSYLQCTEIGYWITGEAPPSDKLPIMSSLLTLHYYRSLYCRHQLHLNLTEIPHPHHLDSYGQYNLSYPRLMLTAGEWDPLTPFTPLAKRSTPTRLDYPSTLDQPYYIIPNGSHEWDLYGIFKSQEEPGVPPEGVKIAHKMEKEAFSRWLREWHALHPNNVLNALQEV